MNLELANEQKSKEEWKSLMRMSDLILLTFDFACRVGTVTIGSCAENTQIKFNPTYLGIRADAAASCCIVEICLKFTQLL